MEVVENGVAELELAPDRLGHFALRRLEKLQARVDGATEVAQAAINAHQAARATYERAFMDACEDAGIRMPDGPHDVDINWGTGEVRFLPKVGM